MNPTSKKFTALLLIFSLMMLSMHLYAKERRGATLIIQRKSDQVKETGLEGTPWETSVITGIRGELITVKPNSLLLLDIVGKDVSVGIVDIKAITIVKKSKLLLGAGIGIAVGGGAGVLLAGSGYRMSLDAPERRIFLGVLGAIVGSLAGGTIGVVVGTDKTIQIEGMTDSEIEEALDKLRKKARIRDYK
jgi:ribosomal protein L6P/L9E